MSHTINQTSSQTSSQTHNPHLADPVVNQEVLQLRHGLERHGVFAAIRDRRDLQTFMQIHVFAVWDFMSLAKRLQRDLTCVSLPWMPPADPEAARLVNDIILAEESDVGPDGQAASHLDLYLGAMREVGASTRVFERFLGDLGDGMPVNEALEDADIPPFVSAFVRATLTTAIEGTTLQTMASFFYGRENVIPAMFQGLLDNWGMSVASAPQFVYYLQRHIELDGDAHGPAASQMVAKMLARKPSALKSTRTAAIEALRARQRLWDGTLLALRRQQAEHQHDARRLEPVL